MFRGELYTCREKPAVEVSFKGALAMLAALFRFLANSSMVANIMAGFANTQS